ncbi:hypothetical protein EON77_00530 [bacterium]|nr:MAG: hypothetical protein EON77_00530 [bacterium]
MSPEAMHETMDGVFPTRWSALPPEPRSADSIWGWWERRRFLFNAIVLPAGFVSFLLLLGVTADAIRLPDGEDMVEPVSVLLAPIGLNVLYFAGALCESLLARERHGRTGKTGPILFALGTGSILAAMAFVVFWPFVFSGAVVRRAATPEHAADEHVSSERAGADAPH